MIYSAAVDISSTEQPRRKKRSSLTDIRKVTIQNFLLTLCNNGYVRAFMIALYFGLCVLYYKKAEHWSVTDSVLFVIVTASTVGYGNPHPTNESSRVFTIFLMMFGVLVIFSSMSGLLNGGIMKLNKFLAYRVTSQLKRTELLFQRRLTFSIVWLVLCVFIGAGIFTALEGWSYITALYFVMQTIMVSKPYDINYAVCWRNLPFVLCSLLTDYWLRGPDIPLPSHQDLPHLLHRPINDTAGTCHQQCVHAAAEQKVFVTTQAAAEAPTETAFPGGHERRARCEQVRVCVDDIGAYWYA